MPEAQASIYVGIDVSKDRLAVAIASGERRDEVLSLGTFDNTPGSVDKLFKKLGIVLSVGVGARRTMPAH